MIKYTLAFACSSDGFIAKYSGDNPFEWTKVIVGIRNALTEHGYTMNQEYIVIKVPNIVDISYGRGVGYDIIEHVPPKEIGDISATSIREQMRKDGKL